MHRVQDLQPSVGSGALRRASASLPESGQTVSRWTAVGTTKPRPGKRNSITASALTGSCILELTRRQDALDICGRIARIVDGIDRFAAQSCRSSAAAKVDQDQQEGEAQEVHVESVTRVGALCKSNETWEEKQEESARRERSIVCVSRNSRSKSSQPTDHMDLLLIEASRRSSSFPCGEGMPVSMQCGSARI